jgi:hypothetical protein
MRVNQYDLPIKTYGCLYEKLVNENAQIPLGICRSHNIGPKV